MKCALSSGETEVVRAMGSRKMGGRKGSILVLG